MSMTTYQPELDVSMAGPAAAQLAVRAMRAIGTTAVVVVTDPAAVDTAERILRDELLAIDHTCSRFRIDSELWSLHQARGAPVKVSPLLFDAVAVALDVAQRTEGAVDPTVGFALEALGYDRDFDEIDWHATEPVEPPAPAPGWWRIELDRRQRTVRVPVGTHLDLGASAKALVADRAARRIAATLRRGVLVSVGGDVAVAGTAPDGGWAVGIATDSSMSPEQVDQVVSIDQGGIATSSTSVRAWRRAGRRVHHIVDPATGESAPTYWTLVSAAGDSCVDANAASTAAVVWGERAVVNLRELGSPARLVRPDGHVVTVNGWPAEAGPDLVTTTPSRPRTEGGS
jgi:thiamine biosynthesis lipoprotein